MTLSHASRRCQERCVSDENLYLLLTGVGRKYLWEAPGIFPDDSHSTGGVNDSLDRATVAKLRLDAGKGDQIFFDADLRGFGYRLRNDGGRLRRTWIVQYRVKGRTRRLKIGDGAKLNADQARQAARKALAAITLGQDPQAIRRAKGSTARAHCARSRPSIWQ